MTDPVEQRVGNLALNAVTKAMCDTHPMAWDLTPEQRRVMVPTFVRKTSDAWLLTIPGLGHKSLAKLRAEWPYAQPLPAKGE